MNEGIENLRGKNIHPELELNTELTLQKFSKIGIGKSQKIGKLYKSVSVSANQQDQNGVANERAD